MTWFIIKYIGNLNKVSEYPIYIYSKILYHSYNATKPSAWSISVAGTLCSTQRITDWVLSVESIEMKKWC